MTLAALAVLLGAACAEVEKPGDDGWKELGGDRPVLFHSSLATPATKSSTLPNNTTFGVFAFYQPGTADHPGQWSSTRTPDFLFNQPVRFLLPDSYSYSPTRYWPSNVYNTLTFWAYSPYSATLDPYSATLDFRVANTNDSYTNTSTGIPDIHFTADGNTDLMVSDRVNDQTYTSNDTNNGVVPLTFNHVLSKIDVKAQKVDAENKYTVTLESVSFIGLYPTAILRGSDSDRIWQVGGTRQEVWSVTPSPSPELSSNTPTNLGSPILIPQDLRDNASRLHVEYSVTYTDNNHTTHSYTQTREAYLRDVFYEVGQTWTKNTHYTLILRITPGNPIQFTVSWDTWGADHNYILSS